MSDAKSSNDRLLSAAKEGAIGALKAALADGADIDYRDEQLWTALMWAARYHHFDAVKLLADKGASLSIRDGFNHDAWDISAKNYLDSTNSGKVRNFVSSHPQYKLDQEKMAEQAKALAKALVKRFGGRSKKQGVAYTHAAYEVSTNYRNMQCRFFVFSTGFDLWIQNFRVGTVSLSLNLEHSDNSTHPERDGGMIAFSDVFLDEFPAYVSSNSKTAKASKEFLLNRENRRDLFNMDFGRFEWLVIGTYQLRMRNQTTNMDLICARVDSLANIFERNSRAPTPPLLQEQFAIKVDRAKGSEESHIFGGSTASPIQCKNCEEPFGQIASFDARAPEFAGLGWRNNKIEVACCFGCALSDTAGLTCISYAAQEPVVLRQPEDIGVDDRENFKERSLRLVPIDPKKHQKVSRVGGQASWIQTDDTPDCPGCGNAMGFFAQFVSSNSIMYGADMGVAYVYLCAACQVVGTAVQSV